MGQPAIFPLKDVRAGMTGTGRTVFQGEKIEEFRVEILGVLENAGPRQSIILARLSGGPLERTGVMQGMSGSPVYIDGKLVGAVALGFPFSKEPIAGIRPIEEMLQVGESPAPRAQRRLRLSDTSLTAHLNTPPAYGIGDTRLKEIATPVSFSGFTQSTLEVFAPQLRALGMEPVQGISGGAAPRTGSAAPHRPLYPGSMISVQLVTGDMNIGADGTVTYVNGKNVFAFGHRFLAAGPTELPFSRSAVMALLPNLSSSFKISRTEDFLGTITSDMNTAIRGEIGKPAQMVPASLTVAGPASSNRYNMQVVNDPLLAPMLLQMALYSSLDATGRVLGQGTVRIDGKVEFEGFNQPLELSNMYAGDFNVPLQVTIGTAMPVAFALQNSLDRLKIRRVDLTATVSPEKKQLQIADIWASRRQVRPGDQIDVTVRFSGPGNQELLKSFPYRIPVGAPAGPLNFTVADGSNTNSSEYRFLSLTEPKPAGRMISYLNGLRGNTKAYVRIWRQDPSYLVEGEDLPDPPPSIALLLNKRADQATLPRTSRLEERVLDPGEFVITGSKSMQVEVKE